MPGENCSSTCATKDHQTFGACLRAKGQMIGYCRSHLEGATDRTRQKQWDRELSEYASAREAGIQPDGTTTAKTRFAVEQSEKYGMKYGEEFNVIPAIDGKGYQAVSKKEVAEITAAVDSGNDMHLIKEAAKGIV